MRLKELGGLSNIGLAAVRQETSRERSTATQEQGRSAGGGTRTAAAVGPKKAPGRALIGTGKAPRDPEQTRLEQLAQQRKDAERRRQELDARRQANTTSRAQPPPSGGKGGGKGGESRDSGRDTRRDAEGTSTGLGPKREAPPPKGPKPAAVIPEEERRERPAPVQPAEVTPVNDSSTVIKEQPAAAPPAPQPQVIQPQDANGGSGGGGSVAPSGGGGGGGGGGGAQLPPEVYGDLPLVQDDPSTMEKDLVNGKSDKKPGAVVPKDTSTGSSAVKYGVGIVAALGLGWFIKNRKKFMGERA